MLESHGLPGLSQFFEFFGPVETVDGQVPGRGAEVLADGQQVAVHFP